MKRTPDLAGQTFGRWTVIAKHDASKRNMMWLCGCDCDNAGFVSTQALLSSHSKSCGCARGCPPRHGHASERSTPTYRSWSAMRRRCLTPTVANYPGYGGRGIGVCDRWNSFENFLADMGPRPDGMSLDRIDSSGNYEPGNCRWADSKTQGRNRSVVKLTPAAVLEILDRCNAGEKQSDVARAFGISPATVCDIKMGRIWSGVSKERKG